MKILFRVDSSSIIGTGHLVRCLTLAKSLRARGADCLFVCRNLSGNSIQRVVGAGFQVKILPLGGLCFDQKKEEFELAHAAWLGVTWRIDAEQTILAIENAFFDWVVVDHYALDIHWESMLRPYCDKLMVIDDLADRVHDCDLLLDQNLAEGWQGRYHGKVPGNCAMLLGPEYALLQPEYVVQRSSIFARSGPIQRILVFFGGADLYNYTGRTLEVFLSFHRPDIFVDVVISPEHPYDKCIREVAEGHSNIILHDALPSLAELLARADLAIGAGGTSSWERCCLGLPTLVVTLAENQRCIAMELERLGLVRWLGHQDEVDEANLKRALLDCLQKSDLRDWSAKCLAVVDGKGEWRVSSIIMLNSQTKFTARLANVDDEGLVLRWVNDPLVRKNAFDSNMITARIHHAWFGHRLSNPDRCKIYIVETIEGLPIGQVRFEINDGNWEIHYALDQYARFRGLGFFLLDTAISSFLKQRVAGNLFGRVKFENTPSQKIFKKLRFDEVVNDTFIQYNLKPDN